MAVVGSEALIFPSGPVIVFGDLKGIRKNRKCKKLNHILSNWAYHKLAKYIEYKAKWEGIKIVRIDERETSHICPKCGSKGKRPYQGLFICENCGYQANADFVGAQNIKRKAEEYISKSGVVCEPALNSEGVVGRQRKHTCKFLF